MPVENVTSKTPANSKQRPANTKEPTNNFNDDFEWYLQFISLPAGRFIF
jgi:hypothetical protein